MPTNLRAAVRKAGVAVTSLAITGALGAAVLTPAQVAFASTARVQSIAGHGEVFYGKVTQDGRNVRGARVVLYHFVGGYTQSDLRVDAIYFTASEGTYRHATNIRPGRYYEQISFRDHGRLRISDPVRRLNVAPGHAYRTDARATHRGLFAFFPAASY